MEKGKKDLKKFFEELEDMAQVGIKERVPDWNLKEKEMLNLISIYFNKKLVQKTWYLATATWVLAIATIILILLGR